jgi:probable rRNA maturation factor
MAISYHIEDIDFKLPPRTPLSKWIKKVTQKEGKTVGKLSYIFCSDEYLHRLNLSYLNHDTLTDIITFPYNTDPIEGDIFISVERVKENATELEKAFEEELRRVIIHGVLHLCGYRDETDDEEQAMRAAEDACLNIFEP